MFDPDAWRGVDDEVLLADVVALQARIDELSLRQALMLGELEVRGSVLPRFGLSPAGWFSREAAVPARLARSQVRLGVALRGRFRRLLDAISAPTPAADAGPDPDATSAEPDKRVAAPAVNVHHAQVIIEATNPRVADIVPERLGDLLADAPGTVFDIWAGRTRGRVELLDQDGPFDPADDITRSELRLRRVGEQTLLSGTLFGASAQLVTQMIDHKTDELFHRWAHDPALSGLNHRQRRAQALVELCEQATATPIDTSARPRAKVILTVTADQPDTTSDRDAVRLQDGSMRSLRCDADLQAVVVSTLGVPLDLGRTRRTVNTAQRAALAARDGGCVFDGCPMPARWTDAHHTTEWHLGGTTDITTTASVCRVHHGIAHRRDWHLELHPDGTTTWTTPDGTTLPGQQHHRRCTLGSSTPIDEHGTGPPGQADAA
jgi:hypothetical protein